MTFYLLLIGIILVPIVMLLPALRNKRAIVDTSRDAENIHIARQRMREIAERKDEEGINFQEAQRELQATLLEDLHEGLYEPPLENTGATEPNTTVAFKRWGVLITLLIPLLSLSLYSYLGNPQFAVSAVGAVSQAGTTQQTQQPDKPFDIDQLLALLEIKLAQDPGNAQGWKLAGKTYMNLGDYEKATAAYAKLNALVVGNADFLVAWADAEIRVTGNVYTPAAKDRIEKALAINPHHVNGLWIASLGAESLGNHAKALTYLNTLLPLVTNDKKSTDNIEQLIERITIKNDRDLPDNTDNGQQQISADRGKTITVKVMLADSLIAQADNNDVVFIFAKALEVPAVPLAVSRHQVSDLPIEIMLTENMAMLPNMTIASFDKITVTARVSKSGKPIQQTGDLVSNPMLVTQEQGDTVKLIIDQIVK